MLPELLLPEFALTVCKCFGCPPSLSWPPRWINKCGGRQTREHIQHLPWPPRWINKCGGRQTRGAFIAKCSYKEKKSHLQGSHLNVSEGSQSTSNGKRGIQNLLCTKVGTSCFNFDCQVAPQSSPSRRRARSQSMVSFSFF